ncbi:GNAT family N-acetyltransferase [Enterococcus sp. AZ109]|uniref:GNAT family N-acetyltransferase n=1 Tax=Enterococcus sp. AZ109 TaxID=2774634 RepID=UPI003F1FF20D
MKIVTEKNEWDGIVKSFPFWDVSHLWGYHESFRLRDYSFEMKLFVFENEKGRLAYPFCVKKLSQHHEYRDYDGEVNYLDTIYGHVGPLYEGAEKQALWESFQSEFRQYCEMAKIALIQERFHPVYQNQIKLFPESHVYEKRKLVVCSTVDYETLYQITYKKNRRYLRKMEAEGLRFVKVGIEEIDGFLELYYDTMDRNTAEEIFYFEKEFFEKLSDELGDLFTLFFCYKDEKVINATICLHSPTSGIGFVMGNDRNYRQYNLGYISAANFLDHFNKIGMPYLITGGGETTAIDDSMLKTKLRYTQEEPAPFFVGETWLIPQPKKEVNVSES